MTIFRKLGRYSAWVIVLAGGFAGQSASAQTVAVPCIDSDDPQVIKKLRAAGSEHAGERTCTQVMADFLQKFDERIKTQASQWYQGCDLDTTIQSNGNGCAGAPVPGVTCNLLRNGVPATFNNWVVEQTSNHMQVSCGNWPFFDSKFTEDDLIVQPIYEQSRLVEDAYNRGAFIQALNCFHNQVKNEIARKTLKVTEGGLCQKPAEVFSKFGNDAVGLSKKIQKDFGEEANLSDVDSCMGTENVTSTDPGRLRQSACQLRAARYSREAMFFQLAACEVFSRAKASYERFLSSTPNKKGVAEAVRAALQGQEGSIKAFKACRRSPARKACVSDLILEKWYKPKFMSIFHEKADAIWNAQSCK